MHLFQHHNVDKAWAEQRVGSSGSYTMAKRHGSLLVGAFPVAEPPMLRYIATSLDHVLEPLGLEVYLPRLKGRQMWRRLYLSNEIRRWITDDVAFVTRYFPDDPLPKAQVAVEFEQFCEGMPLILSSDVRCLRPQEQSVWELKTPDVRLFGWFVCRDAMVIHLGADANVLKEPGSDRKSSEEAYRTYVRRVADFRASLPLDIPCEMGKKLSDVLSNRIR